MFKSFSPSSILFIKSIHDFLIYFIFSQELSSIGRCIPKDKFNLSNEVAKLDYPVALITADEVAMAGGVLELSNKDYYLYSGSNIWTFSPAAFATINTHAYEYSIDGEGDLDWHYNIGLFNIRPVINLKADTLITKGDGSALNPFAVET